MKDWKETLLTDVTSKIGDGLHGTPKYDNGGEYYFINGNNLVDGKIIIKTETKKVNKSEFLKHQKPLSSNTILLGINGTFGNVAFYNNEKCILGKSACYINVNEKVDKKFLYYNFLNNDFQLFLESIATGTTIPNVPLKGLREYSFILPTISEQQSIAEVLSSLDDKIDLLHRQNNTLEQMAETLFRQWFVEEAKEDWEEKPLDQLAEYLNGLALQKFPAIPGKPTLPAIKIREMNQGITEATDIISAEIPEKYIVNDGDILFSWSGSLDVITWTGGKGALNQHLFKVTSSTYPKWLIYFSTRLFLPEFRDIANDKATTMGHIQRSHLTQSVLRIPPHKIIEKSDKIVSDLFDKIIHNKIQIRSIEKLRDTLLPKLMNGSVRITSN